MVKNPNSTITSSKKLIYLLGGVSALVILIGGGLTFGLNSKLTGLLSAAAQKEQAVGTSEQVARRYQSTLDNYNETQSHIQFLETSVSPKSYVPTLLQQLQTLALQTHLTVTAVRPATPPPPAAPAPRRSDTSDSSGTAADTAKKAPPPPPYDTMDIGVDVTGTYADTITFLYDLTRFPKIMSVASVQMHPGNPAPGQSATSSPLVTTNLHLTAFVFHDDGPSAVAAAPNGPAATVASVVPGAAPATVAGAAGRATQGAIAATNAANQRSQTTLASL